MYFMTLMEVKIGQLSQTFQAHSKQVDRVSIVQGPWGFRVLNRLHKKKFLKIEGKGLSATPFLFPWATECLATLLASYNGYNMYMYRLQST